MAGNKQLDAAAKVVNSLQDRLVGAIDGLKQNFKALTAGGIVPPKPKKDLIRALERLRAALNRAILDLEKKIAGKRSVPRKKTAARKKSNLV
jgi:hypothetical protein